MKWDDDDPLNLEMMHKGKSIHKRSDVHIGKSLNRALRVFGRTRIRCTVCEDIVLSLSTFNRAIMPKTHGINGSDDVDEDEKIKDYMRNCPSSGLNLITLKRFSHLVRDK